jgi:FkbM family methyltransferase
MRLPDAALLSAAIITRHMPPFRGLGMGYRLLNSAMMRWGADPLVKARMKDGTRLRVDLRTRTEVDAFYRGEYDADLLAIVFRIFDSSATFVDVGANIGFYTVAVARLLKSQARGGGVLAFEPVASNYQRLQENLRGNDLLDCCQTFPLGLSNASGAATITLREDFLQGGETGNAAIAISPDFDLGFERATIALARFDDLWPRLRTRYASIDLMKLDIEGHEDCALEGARRTIEAQRPTILMEVNKAYFRARHLNLDERFGSLLPAGYVTYRQVGGAWKRTYSLEMCRSLDNVFLVPLERLNRPGYEIFNSGGG